MTSIRLKVEINRTERKWMTIPSIDRRLFGGALLLSMFIHFLSWLGSTYVNYDITSQNQSTVKFRSMSTDEKKLIEKLKKAADESKRMLETPQLETEAPTAPSRLGAQDHATKKEMKIADKFLRNSKAQDAGAHLQEKPTPTPTPITSIQPPPVKTNLQKLDGSGTMSIGSRKDRTPTNYEKLLPDKSKDVFATPNGGYMERVDADVTEGDRIDMNTTSFKYISYFTGFRKQIELVWIYPSDAIQRGLQGDVQLEITLEKDGRVSKVRLVHSSGYQSLDDNMIKTIKLASPFAPLPTKWKRDRLVVTGTFQHILSYAAH